METFYGILVAIILALALMAFQIKKKKNSWVGVVIKIKTKDANYNSDPEYSSTNDWTSQVYIHYQTDSGRKGKINIPKHQLDKMYPDLKAGDRLSKKAGDDFPVKI
jgi:hypothetical protein